MKRSTKLSNNKNSNKRLENKLKTTKIKDSLIVTFTYEVFYTLFLSYQLKILFIFFRVKKYKNKDNKKVKLLFMVLLLFVTVQSNLSNSYEFYIM